MTEQETFAWVPRRLPLANLVRAFNNKRLAVHVFEDGDKICGMSHLTRGWLLQMLPEDIVRRLAEDSETPLLSMTLLVPDKPIRSWSVNSQNNGYLFDLSSEAYAHPPRVVAAFEGAINSGYDPRRKTLEGGSCISLCHLASPMAQTAMRNGMSGALSTLRKQASDDLKHSNENMDWLAWTYEDSNERQYAPNEILVATAPEHVSALVVPFNQPQGTNATDKYIIHQTLHVFDGALNYLQHEAAGTPLPLMGYDSRSIPPRLFGMAYNKQEAIALGNMAQDVATRLLENMPDTSPDKNELQTRFAALQQMFGQLQERTHSPDPSWRGRTRAAGSQAPEII